MIIAYFQSFQPPFAIDTDRFEFTPRIQKLNELDAFSRVKINFLNKIASFWNLQGAQFKVPVIDNKYVDLYRLHKVLFKDVNNGCSDTIQTCSIYSWSAIMVDLNRRVHKRNGQIYRNC